MPILVPPILLPTLLITMFSIATNPMITIILKIQHPLIIIILRNPRLIRVLLTHTNNHNSRKITRHLQRLRLRINKLLSHLSNNLLVLVTNCYRKSVLRLRVLIGRLRALELRDAHDAPTRCVRALMGLSVLGYAKVRAGFGFRRDPAFPGHVAHDYLGPAAEVTALFTIVRVGLLLVGYVLNLEGVVVADL